MQKRYELLILTPWGWHLGFFTFSAKAVRNLHCFLFFFLQIWCQYASTYQTKV